MTLDRRRLLAAGLLLALGGCTTSRAPVLRIKNGSGDGALESLVSVRADQFGLVLEVISHGCTARADFVFFLDRAAVPPTLAFARKRLDICKGRMGDAVKIKFSYEELGVTPGGELGIDNPVVK